MAFMTEAFDQECIFAPYVSTNQEHVVWYSGQMRL